MDLRIFVVCHKTKRKITIGEHRLYTGIKRDVLPDSTMLPEIMHITQSEPTCLADIINNIKNTGEIQEVLILFHPPMQTLLVLMLSYISLFS
jgi:hypothetical protein